MSKILFMALVTAGAVLPVLPAGAAPAATQAEADRLRGVLERYVGHPEAGQPGSISVTPEGTSYRASFDLQRMARPLQSFGISLDPATQTLVLTPNDTGTWHVAGTAMPPLVVHLKDQTVAMKTGGYGYDGTFDPKLGFFTAQTATQDGTTLDQEAPALSQHRRSGHSVLTETATPAGSDHADVDAHYAVADTTADVTTHAPETKGDPTAPPPAPMHLSITLPITTADVHVDRLHAWSLLDLWAFFVAHPSREAITAGQDDLRGLLRSALPMLAGFKESASGDNLAVQAPPGAFKADELAFSVDLGDLAAAGRVAIGMSVNGLVLPNLSLPAWSAGLLPTSVDLHPSVTGFHVDEAARVAVDTFDLKHDGFTGEQRRMIGKVLWPGSGTVALAPSHITAPLLDLKLEGQGSAGPVPAGHLTVTGIGLDKAIASLQGAVASDESAAQVLTQLVAAKNLGKPNPDGSIVWVIEASAEGPLSVNGIPLR